MVLVVRGTEKRRHEALIESMFRLRYDHFIGRRGWSLPSRKGMDVDQYDSDDAVYFIKTGADGAIEATARLNQTQPSSLLADLFPFLIETGEEPRGRHLFEGSRFVVCPKERSRTAIRSAKSEVLSALIEYCMDHGGRDFQAVIDANMLPAFVEMSLHTRPLGLAHPYGGGLREFGGGRCVAFRWRLSDELLADLREYAAMPEMPDLTLAHDIGTLN